jgi:hypothetical protein
MMSGWREWKKQKIKDLFSLHQGSANFSSPQAALAIHIFVEGVRKK